MSDLTPRERGALAALAGRDRWTASPYTSYGSAGLVNHDHDEWVAGFERVEKMLEALELSTSMILRLEKLADAVAGAPPEDKP